MKDQEHESGLKKVLQVVESCTTLEQLRAAFKYYQLFMRAEPLFETYLRKSVDYSYMCGKINQTFLLKGRQFKSGG